MNKLALLLALVAVIVFAMIANVSCSGGDIQSGTLTEVVNQPTQNTAASASSSILGNLLNGVAL